MTADHLSSTERLALEALRDAGEPLTADQLLDRLPSYVRSQNSDPRGWLRQHVLGRSEVGRVARGTYVYLPTRITGSTLRVPLTGLEAEAGHLWVGIDLIGALWFRDCGDYHPRPGGRATCVLPGGQRSSILFQHHDGLMPNVLAGTEMIQWLREEKMQAGDSLLFHVEDGERGSCRVSREPLARREPAAVTQRNEQLLDYQPWNDLSPWLAAVGYSRGGERDARDETDGEQVSIWARQAFRLRVARASRKSGGHVFEIRGDQTLGELDQEIRWAFDYDTFDHLSGFYVPVGGRRGKEDLGEIYPDGTGEGAAWRVGELQLETGDRLEYVYDFGDWIEHAVTVEAVVAAETEVEYPREVPRRRHRSSN